MLLSSKRPLCLLLTLSITSLAPAWPALADPSVEVAFSPRGGATDTIVRLIDDAERSILVAAYSFTSRDIARALVAAHGRGVDVRAVLDKSNATDRYTSATFLANAGIPTRINDRYAIMHNKFMVMDGTTVQTGSFNYTKAAEQENAENIVILRDAPGFASQYSALWQRLWDEGREYVPRH